MSCQLFSFRGATALLLALSLLIPFPSMALDSDAEGLARRKRVELDREIVDVREFLGESFFSRHKGAIAGLGLAVLAITATVLTGGAAAGPSTLLATSGGASLGLGGLALETGGAATGIAAGSALDEFEELHIPSGRRDAVLRFYDANWRKWAEASSTEEEFSARVLSEVRDFLRW